MIGTLLSGRFRIEERIGHGGMSTVYRAFDETLERWVAIKVLHADISEDPDQLERFHREARTAARLSHPHVVTVIDAGEDHGRPFIVFEYVEGETLKDRIRRLGRLPVVEAVAYAIEIGRALIAAHAERLVHRDVKPQNVLIDREGRAKVTDFGIARSLEVQGLTAPGRVLGTTDYVAPEQAIGESVSEQSDVYALGICLWEMLTGDVPFRADSQVGVAMAHVRDPLPDVRARRPEVSASLAAVIDRATAKETRNRYATAAETVRELEHVLAIEAARAGESSGEATTVLRSLSGDTADFVPARVRRPHLLLTLGLAATAVAVALVVVFLPRTEQGTTGGAAPKRQAGLVAVRLPSSAANDFDPLGDDEEHPADVRNAIDDQLQTYWATELYDTRELGDVKPGVGLYVSARRPVEATRLSLITPLPGWDAEVYAANGDSPPDALDGWTKVGARKNVRDEERMRLNVRGRRFRHYLVWVTRLAPERQAAIQELTLQQPDRG